MSEGQSVYGSGVDPAIDDTGETFRLARVFKRSFAIFGRRFVPFVVLAVLASIPNFVAELVIGDKAPFVDSWLSVVTQSLIDGVVICGVVQELRGRSFSLGDSLRVAFGRFLALLAISIGTSIITAVGLLLLVVPGLVFSCMFFVAQPVCVTERAGFSESMSRSEFLTRGYRGQVFCTIVVMVVVEIIGFAAAGAVFEMAGPVGTEIGIQAAAAILGAFNGVVTGVCYYELRVAKEGVDIDRIASVFD